MGRHGVLPKLRYSPDKIYQDRKSTRLNSSHSQISYAVFCLKKNNLHSVNRLLSVVVEELIATHVTQPSFVTTRNRLAPIDDGLCRDRAVAHYRLSVIHAHN